GPQLVDVLEPDAEPQQVLGHPVSLPAVARLHRRLDPAEARRVLDQMGRRLDPARITVDVEREHPAETGVAQGLDLRMRLEAACDLARGLGLAANAYLEGLQAAEQEVRGVGRGDDSRSGAELAQAVGGLRIAADDCA